MSTLLIINPRKYAELVDFIRSPRTSLLILQGPTGCGKHFSLAFALKEQLLKFIELTFHDSSIASVISRCAFLPRTTVGLFKDLPALEDCHLLASWLRQPGIKPRLVIIAQDGREEDQIINALSSVSTLITFRPLTDLAIKRLILSVTGLSTPAMEDLALASHGDARYALNALRLMNIPIHAASSKRKGKETISSKKTVSTEYAGKDEELTFFHAVARTLYAKVETFDPAKISELPCVSDAPDQFVAFLLENAVDFKFDINSVAKYSSFLAHTDRPQFKESLRLDIAIYGWASLGSNIGSNRGFRELRKPRYFQVFKTRNKNSLIIRKYVSILTRQPFIDCRKFWYCHLMLCLTGGNFFGSTPTGILAALHAIASYQEVPSDFADVACVEVSENETCQELADDPIEED